MGTCLTSQLAYFRFVVLRSRDFLLDHKCLPCVEGFLHWRMLLNCRINLGCEGLRQRKDFLAELCLSREVLFIMSGLKCSQNAGKLHSESSKFQIFLTGEHAPKTPSNGA